MEKGGELCMTYGFCDVVEEEGEDERRESSGFHGWLSVSWI